MVDLLGEPLETSTQALASVARKHSLWAQMLADGASGSGICALEGCNRARQGDVGCACDICCERCGATAGHEHDQWCDERACEWLCALEGCNCARQYAFGCDWDRCCKRCFISEGEEHDPCCDRRACDNGQRSLEETENSMTAAEEDGPTAAARPAAVEEYDAASTSCQVNKRCVRTYWAARAAAYGASQENDVCS